MATKYEIDLAINAASTASTVKEVKNSMKELNSLALKFGEGSAEFEKVTAAAGDLKDRIEDVNQAINAKKGTGFEKFGGELGILGDKLSNLDFKGANESIGRIATTIKGVSFKDISEGVKGFTGVLGNLGKAILANPIFLIAGIVIAVGAAFILLKDKVKILSEAFAFLSDIVGGVIDFFKDLTDELGLTAFAAEESADRQIAAAQKVRKSAEENYDAEIALRKAAGEETFKIEQEKQKVIQQSIDDELAGIQAKIEASGDYVDGQRTATDEQKKQIAELEKARRDSALAQRVSEISEAKKTADDLKKIADEAQKDREKRAAERLAANKTLLKEIEDDQITALRNQDEREFAAAVLANERAVKSIEESKANNALKNEALLAQAAAFEVQLEAVNIAAAERKKKREEEDATKIKEAQLTKLAEDQELTDLQFENQLILNQDNFEVTQELKLAQLEADKELDLEQARLKGEDLLSIEQDYENRKIEIKMASAEREKELDRQRVSATFQIAQASNDSLIALSDLYFTVKKNNTKKGSAEEEKAARQQFKINKALAIQSAIISGIQGVVNALSAQSIVPEPFGTILRVATAVGVGIAAAVNVAKIASTQFNPGGGGGGGGGAAVPAAPAAPAGIAPAAGSNAAPAPRVNDFSLFGTAGKSNSGSQQNQRLSVSVDEISSTTKRVDGYKSASELK